MNNNNYLDFNGLQYYDDKIKDYIAKQVSVIILNASDIANNPIIPYGRFGFDITNKSLKIGDGETPWNNLAGVLFS